MKRGFNVGHRLPLILAKPEREVFANGGLWRVPASWRCILLLGVRSPSDQLQVVAIKPGAAHKLA
jgi:hypothetical protein